MLPGGRGVGEQLVAHPGVDKVAFTGSTAAGRQVAAACGAALKRVSLELGGKSAAIVLDDADPAAVAQGVRVAGLMNSGQACVAQTRVLVPASRHDEMVEALAAMVTEIPVGDPTERTTEIGPLVARRQQERVRGYIESGRREGARLVVGGTDLPAGVDRGWYVRPTLFAGVDNGMTIAREEIFGPVLSVIPYGDDDEAVRIADDSDYGLSGSVWTADTARGLGIARRVRTGSFGVNQPYSMDPAAPFGGMKGSGIGRELGGRASRGTPSSSPSPSAPRRQGRHDPVSHADLLPDPDRGDRHMTTTDADVYYDPFDFEIDADPYPVWKRLREEHPLYYNEKYDFYALSRFDDVEQGLSDWRTYSSVKGTLLELIKSGMEIPPGSIIFEDPPDHDLHRGLLSRVFTPRKMAAIEPQVREFCARTLDPLVGAGGFDFIADLGAQMPMRTIGMLLGIPEQDQEASATASTRACASTTTAPCPTWRSGCATPTTWPAASRSTSTGGPSTPPTT